MKQRELQNPKKTTAVKRDKNKEKVKNNNQIAQWHQSCAHKETDIAMVNVSVTADGHIRTTALSIDRSHAPAILQELENLTHRLRTFVSKDARPPAVTLRLISSK